MKISTLFISLFLCVSFINAQKNGKVKQYYDNGEFKGINSYINGKKNGEWKYYYENGQLVQIGSYKEGNRNGEYKWYHDNGKLNKIDKYDNGEIKETWLYDESGKVEKIKGGIKPRAER